MIDSDNFTTEGLVCFQAHGQTGNFTYEYYRLVDIIKPHLKMVFSNPSQLTNIRPKHKTIAKLVNDILRA